MQDEKKADEQDFQKYKKYYYDKGPLKKLKQCLNSSFFLGIIMKNRQQTQQLGAIRKEDHITKILTEKEKESIMSVRKKHGLIPILPENRYKIIWDIMLIISLVVFGLMSPFMINFYKNETSPDYQTFEQIMAVQFMIDIIINFVTGYIDEQKRVITNLRMIWWNYLTSWFLLDLLSAFPFNWVSNDGSGDIVVFIKYIKLPRLLKIQKYTNQQYKSQIIRFKIYWFTFMRKLGVNISFFNLFKLIAIIILVNHYAACFYFNTFSPESGGTNSWVQNSNLHNVDIST